MSTTISDSSYSRWWNPLWISEIAQLTFRSSGRADGCRLARTCQRLFHSLMPLVWEDIRDVEHVLTLLQGVKVIATSTFDIYIAGASLSDEGLSRFRLYAPFIKHLNLSKRNSYPYQYVLWDWRRLFDRRGYGPLLPNLRSLTFNADLTSTGFEQTIWFTLFLSPSLRELRLTLSDWDSHNNLSVAGLFFTSLVASLPALATQEPLSIRLAAFTESLLSNSLARELTKDSGWFGNPPNLTGLHRLAIHILAIRTDELYILGLLPALKHLELNFGLDEGLDNSNLKLVPTLPDNAFPRLRHLSLIHLPDVSALRDLWNINGLVSKLMSVEIQLNKYRWTMDESPAQAIQDLVTAICEQSPKVTDLTIQLPPPESPYTKTSSSAPMFELLSRLPLQRLRYTSLTPFHLFFVHHKTSYPLLRRLELTSAWVDPLDMRALARILPSLEYLAVNITMSSESSESVRPEPFTSPQPITIYIMSVYTEDDSGGDQRENGIDIGFLKVLWPNAQYLVSRSANDTLPRCGLTVSA